MLSECGQEEGVFVLHATHFALTNMHWLSSTHKEGMKVSETQVSNCWHAYVPSLEPEEDMLPGSELLAEGGDRNSVSTCTNC
jgi:hypothetical protein